MNQRNLWTIAGLGALSIALIALPGSSKQIQEPGGAAPLEPPSNQRNVEVYTIADGPQSPDAKVQELDGTQDNDGNFQFFMGSGGGWLGVGVSEVSTAKAKSLKLPEEHGAVAIERVSHEGRMTREAGTKAQDIARLSRLDDERNAGFKRRVRPFGIAKESRAESRPLRKFTRRPSGG